MTQQLSAPLHSVRSGQPDAPHRVAFVHGLFGRGRNFSRIATGLEPDAQSLLIDLPNHGQSPWTERVDYREMADLVADHLRADFASTGPIDLVGHSMGGKVAMVLALTHPDLVRRLVVVDISPTAAESSRGEFEHLLDSLIGLDLEQVGRRADADEALKEPISHPTVRGFLLQNLKRGDNGFEWEPNLHLLRAELGTIVGFPSMSGAQFSGDVLWLGGSRSDYVTDEDEPIMFALFPHTERLMVEGAGHWIHSEKPAETIESLRDFLLE